MTKRQNPNPEFDLFIPLMGDLPLKDQRETMERPFFSLQKRKRVKPIEYSSPDGETWVKIEAIPAYGMATIWDADILIWAASTLNRMREQGANDIPRTLRTTSYDLLRAIKRDTSGRAYQELQAALQRLQTTSISTSIRAPKRRTKAGFNWLDKWTLEVDPDTDQPRGMTITLSDWVYEGIMGERSLLTMHQDYFLLTGGLERALYRIARKHAGNQKGGWTCRVEVLRDKTGSDSKPKEFNRMLRKVVEADQLPDYAMEMATTADGSPAVLFRLRGETEALALTARLEAEQERRSRFDADRRRAAEVDDLMDKLSGGR
ncbi:replication initiator protein A [Sphingomonas aracearum]|uniref:Plasmid replication initiator protein n=1 Tax=Sphingomonas aracearum TaxID=2283317 RepID=A0A369VTR8_9SPHN|nr:replication initiator protein A [Sphingomonas aracearum]RDE04462.1 plasmid replication initiator protein [Sphingomonas aracearum]